MWLKWTSHHTNTEPWRILRITRREHEPWKPKANHLGNTTCLHKYFLSDDTPLSTPKSDVERGVSCTPRRSTRVPHQDWMTLKPATATTAIGASTSARNWDKWWLKTCQCQVFNYQLARHKIQGDQHRALRTRSLEEIEETRTRLRHLSTKDMGQGWGRAWNSWTNDSNASSRQTRHHTMEKWHWSQRKPPSVSLEMKILIEMIWHLQYPETYENKPGRLNVIGTLPTLGVIGLQYHPKGRRWSLESWGHMYMCTQVRPWS